MSFCRKVKNKKQKNSIPVLLTVCLFQPAGSSAIYISIYTRGGNREPVPTQNQFQLTASIVTVRLQHYLFFLTILSFPCLHKAFWLSWNFATRYICVTLSAMTQTFNCKAAGSDLFLAWLHFTKQDQNSSVQCCNIVKPAKTTQTVELIYLDYIFFLHYILSRCCSVCLSWICSCSQSCADIILWKKIKWLLLKTV